MEQAPEKPKGETTKKKNSTEQSLEDGRKAIETEKKVTPGSETDKEKASKEDAEKWRNEG